MQEFGLTICYVFDPLNASGVNETLEERAEPPVLHHHLCNKHELLRRLGLLQLLSSQQTPSEQRRRRRRSHSRLLKCPQVVPQLLCRRRRSSGLRLRLQQRTPEQTLLGAGLCDLDGAPPSCRIVVILQEEGRSKVRLAMKNT